MNRTSALAAAALAAPTLSTLSPALAQGGCPRIDFENLAVGTAITNQYPGITFSVVPQSCNNNPTLFMRITTATEGTSSGTRCLKIDEGCPSFSDAFLRMNFDVPQAEVTFTLGDWAGNYTVRAYTAAGLPIGVNQVINLPGVGTVSVHRLVRVTAPLHDLGRIEVEGANDAFEAIDDLTLVDVTPPTARLNTPVYEACGCGSVNVTGIVCEDDGKYGNDRLEYRAVGAAPGAPWTQIGMFTAPLCAGGTLYTWNTAAIAEGLYYLRLTVTNACGLSSTDQTVVYVDKSFAVPALNSPVNNGIFGGNICFDGTVNDHCFSSYSIKYRPAGGGAFQSIQPLIPLYFVPITNDSLANWTAAIPDGDYQVEVRGLDSCGNAAAVVRNITIDNTLPMAIINTPVSCTYRCGIIAVTGMATDAHLSTWILDYMGGNQHTWSAPLAQGNANFNGVIHNWNVAALTPCAYVLRLRAWDTATVSCIGSGNYREFLTCINIGGYADCDRVGGLSANDFQCFLDAYAAGCT